MKGWPVDDSIQRSVDRRVLGVRRGAAKDLWIHPGHYTGPCRLLHMLAEYSPGPTPALRDRCPRETSRLGVFYFQFHYFCASNQFCFSRLHRQHCFISIFFVSGARNKHWNNLKLFRAVSVFCFSFISEWATGFIRLQVVFVLVFKMWCKHASSGTGRLQFTILVEHLFRTFQLKCMTRQTKRGALKMQEWKMQER